LRGNWLSILPAFLAVLIIILGIFFIAGMVFPKNLVITPKIEPVIAGQAPVPISSSFPFQDGTVSISVSLNGSVLDGARKADKNVTIIGNISENSWVSRSYRAMIEDSQQDALFEDLISQFRKIRAQKNLSDDEYLELMAVYVQLMKYETVSENPAKFPIETVADGAGDCDDKSLLLAGLLSREGYDVALLTFGPENHMALGIGSDDYRYDTTNYTFLETTNLTYVGVPTEKLGEGRPLVSVPLIIPIGTGTKKYTCGNETRYITEMADLTESKAEELEPRVRALNDDLSEQQKSIIGMEEQMQSLRSSGNIREYNAMVSTHNARVSAYTTKLGEYRQLYARYEQYATVHNNIVEHPYDRKGGYEYIRKAIPAGASGT